MIRILSASILLVFSLSAFAFEPPHEKPVTAKHAMVVSAQHLATKVGVNILQRGGNAIDAAVAVGYALAVVHPCCGNIGGGGFMLIRFANGRRIFLNFREKAPMKATKTMFQNKQGRVIPGASTQSFLSVGVPGTVMGLDTALKRYGTMTREQVMAPAIRLADKGFVLTAQDANLLDSRADAFKAHANVAAVFLNHGKPYRPGDRLVQHDLAHSLRRIEKHGSKAFYQGPIAHKIVEASQARGGILSMRDFKQYTAKWQKPIRCGYKGYTIVSAPPPSSGGTTLCEILQIVKPYPFSRWGFRSVKSVHYLVEAMRHAFADRNTYLGDPNFVDNPVAKLLSAPHAKNIRAAISPHSATPSRKVSGSLGSDEGNDTTHYSIVDTHGNAVAVTYTINFLFGSKLIAGDTGFFLNDEMDDFTAKKGVATDRSMHWRERRFAPR